MAAAGTASGAELVSVVGQLGVELLLNRFPGRVVVAGAYLIPVAESALLLVDGTSPMSQTAAAALFGLTLARRRRHRVSRLAVLGAAKLRRAVGGLVAAMLLGIAFGPLCAAAPVPDDRDIDAAAERPADDRPHCRRG